MLQVTPETLAYIRTYQRQAEAKQRQKIERKAEARKHRSRLNDQARAALTATVAHVLRTGQPTKFEYEAACRHGLRQAFILNEGWRWSVADAEAAEIVAGGLRLIGAERPTYDEGQVDFAVAHRIDRHYCARCGTPIPDERKASGSAKYCSTLCNVAATQARARVSGERVDLAQHLARIAQKSAATVADRTRECEICGAGFLAASANGRFCSKTCAHIGHRERAPKPCAACGETFKPRLRKDGLEAKYCSLPCAAAGQRKEIEQRACVECGTDFVPSTNRPQVYCSMKCSGKASRKERPDLTCATCRTGFRPRFPSDKRLYCSQACSRARNKPSSTFTCEEAH